METRRWANPSQPQTLYMATFLLYFNAFFLVLSFNPVTLILAVGCVVAGFGIANERRWGYILGVVVATLDVLPLLLYVLANGVTSVLSVTFLLNALFPVALFALLIHPMSREYQRIWFH